MQIAAKAQKNTKTLIGAFLRRLTPIHHITTNVYVWTNGRFVNKKCSTPHPAKQKQHLQSFGADAQANCNLLTNAGNTDFANHHISIQDAVEKKSCSSGEVCSRSKENCSNRRESCSCDRWSRPVMKKFAAVVKNSAPIIKKVDPPPNLPD